MVGKQINKSTIKILICPKCKKKLISRGRILICKNNQCRAEYNYFLRQIPILLKDRNTEDNLTLIKWNQSYKTKFLKKDLNLNKPYLNLNLEYFKKYWLHKKGIFLEAGCGSALDSIKVVKEFNIKALGLDISLDGMKKAQQLISTHKANVDLVVGDMVNIPLQNNSVDFIYAGGSIEHLRNTTQTIRELYRVLNKKGRILATVPAISLSMLTYGQLQANIPNIFIIKNIVNFIHEYLLKGRFMINGFELSFTKSQLKNEFEKGGFKIIEIDNFSTPLDIRRIKNKFLNNFFKQIAQTKLFHPMLFIVAEK